jgi:hypothetical protein
MGGGWWVEGKRQKAKGKRSKGGGRRVKVKGAGGVFHGFNVVAELNRHEEPR